MKTASLLDTVLDTVLDNVSNTISETKSDTDKIPPTVSVRSNDKPQSDWFDKQFNDMEKQSKTINYTDKDIIETAIELDKECHISYNKNNKKPDFVYYNKETSWIGISNKDYNELIEVLGK